MKIMKKIVKAPLIVSTMGAVMYLVGFACSGGEFNPLNWPEKIEITQREIQVKKNSRIAKRAEIGGLMVRVLRKAEMSDRVPGLGFQDKGALFRDLGLGILDDFYRGNCNLTYEANESGVGAHIFLNFIDDTRWLNKNKNKRFYASKEMLEDYLNN